MKYINFKRYKFSTVLRNINFSRIYKHINLGKINITKINKYIDPQRIKFSRIRKYIDIRRIKFSKFFGYFDYKKYKNYPLYLFVFLVFSIIIYLIIPKFYNYDKLKVENIICKNLNIECSVKGKISYSFFPYPSIKIKNLVIHGLFGKKVSVGKIQDIILPLDFSKLLDRKNINFTKIKLENAALNLDFENLDKYKNFILKKNISKPIYLKKGNIQFSESSKYIAMIENVVFKYKPKKNTSETVLKGDFLGDQINLKIKQKSDLSKIITLKLSNYGLFTKINILKPESGQNLFGGNILFKKDKNSLTAIFDYKNDKIIVKHANLRNTFLDGKLNGEIAILPYLSFNLDVDLSSLNFNRLHAALIDLKDDEKKNIFKINKKINGEINLFINKIFSKHTLVNSIESNIKFLNGDILIDQMLFSLGKMGAADVNGVIKNDNKFSNFRFDSNIFLDNSKTFYNKFGIYNKEAKPLSVFISGNFNFKKLYFHFNEISKNNKVSEEDLTYIEKEFNDILLEEGYVSFFNFRKLREFFKVILDEDN